MKPIFYFQMTDAQKLEALQECRDITSLVTTEEEYFEHEGEFDFYVNKDGNIIAKSTL